MCVCVCPIRTSLPESVERMKGDRGFDQLCFCVHVCVHVCVFMFVCAVRVSV